MTSFRSYSLSSPLAEGKIPYVAASRDIIIIYTSLGISSSHLLHLLWHLMRVQHAGHRDSNLSLLLVSGLERLLALLEEKVGVVLARELTNLHEKVSQVLLERGDVLIEVEEPSHSYLDLREMKRHENRKHNSEGGSSVKLF